MINEFIWKITLGESINVAILAITAFIVILYTRAAQKSNEIREKPILNLYLREAKTGANIERTLRLRNVGRGPAYNISFASIEAGGYVYSPRLKEPNIILERDGDEKSVDFWVETPTGGVEAYDKNIGFQFFLSRLFPSQAPKEEHEQRKRTSAMFLINYEGVNDKKYHSIFRLYSKIWPLLNVYDLVVEFILSGDGECNMNKAQQICSERKSIEHQASKKVKSPK